MAQRFINKIKQKEVWTSFRKRRTQTRYAVNSGEISESTWAVREAVCQFNKSLANEVKENPSAFYAYGRSKTRIKETLTKLSLPNGYQTNTTQEASKLQYREFQSLHQRTHQLHPSILRQLEGVSLQKLDFSLDEIKEILEGFRDF